MLKSYVIYDPPSKNIFINASKQNYRVPITSIFSNFKGETQHYVVNLPKSAGARKKSTGANSSPDYDRGIFGQYCLAVAPL